MRTFLILASTLGVVYAGVGTLSPSEEANALQLFNRLCSGHGAEGQVVGGTRVYCKRASGVLSESQNHRVNVPGQSGSGQTVFIQPPPARYHHNVEIVSQGGLGDQTKIYVLPQQATHTINPNIQQTPGSQNKPVVYFLKGGSSSSSNGSPSYGALAQPSQPIQQNYGVPQVVQKPVGPPNNQLTYGAPPTQQNYGAPPKQSNYGAPPPTQPSYGPPPTHPVQGGYPSPGTNKPVSAGYDSLAVFVPIGGY